MSLSLLTYCVKASPSFYLEMCAYQYFRLLQGVPAVTPGSGTWDDDVDLSANRVCLCTVTEGGKHCVTVRG